MFAVLAALLVIAGAGLALYGPPIFSLCGWLTGVILVSFGFLGRWLVLKKNKLHNMALTRRAIKSKIVYNPL